LKRKNLTLQLKYFGTTECIGFSVRRLRVKAKYTLITALLILVALLPACDRKTKEELFAEGVKQLNAANSGGAIIFFKNALEKDENYIDARFQLAKSYAAMGKLEQAEKEFLKVLKQSPARDEVLLELAAVYNAAKKGEQAFEVGEQYLVKHPGNAEGYEILGVASAVMNKDDDAERYLLLSLASDPSRAKPRIELAGVYVSAGKVRQAKTLLENLVRSYPENIKALYMLAAVDTMGGNSDKALEIYKKILLINSSESSAIYKTGMIYLAKGDFESAGKAADNLVMRFPKQADGYRLKGLLSYQRKNYPEAMVDLQNSLKIMPTLEAYYFLGLCYYNRGELETSLSQFRKILDNVPTSRKARLMTGAILLMQKHVDDAITEIQKVLRQNDRDAAAHNLLGNAYMAKGMFTEGMRELNQATKIDPRIVDAYLKKGLFYFSHGKDVEGEAELATAVKAAPDVLNSRLLLASYYFRSGKIPKSLSVLKAGLTGNKSDALLHNCIAAIYISQNKLDEGLKSIQRAKDVDPAFPGSYQNLATFYVATGKYEKAVEEYRSLLRNAPRNLDAMFSLAALYEIKGNEAEALICYEKAMDTKQPAAYLATARYFQRKREIGKALKVLEEALKYDSRNIAVLEMKGRLMVAGQKYKKAIKVFEEIETINPEAGITLKINTFVAMKYTAKALEQARRIVEMHPYSAWGYQVLASVYESQKDYRSAIKEVKNGLRVDGNNAQTILYLGNLYESSKDYTQAMSLYAEALRKKPDFAPALFAQGALLEIGGKKNDAIGKYRSALEKNDSYVPALNNLAYLYASGYGSREEALRLAISAYNQEPGNAMVMDTLGFALLQNKRPEVAKKVLEKAAGLLPANPAVHYHLAMAYKETGDKNNALRILEKSLALGDFPDAKAAASLVATLKGKR
jgi:putative PEP-CTERM system TPR-repeat lipoprotein